MESLGSLFDYARENQVKKKFEFDLQKAREAARKGIDTVESHNEDFTSIARDLADAIARRHMEVTCDDVRAVCTFEGIAPKHPNAWGAVFRKHPTLEFTGETRPSKVPSRHGNHQRVWRVRVENSEGES